MQYLSGCMAHGAMNLCPAADEVANEVYYPDRSDASRHSHHYRLFG